MKNYLYNVIIIAIVVCIVVALEATHMVYSSGFFDKQLEITNILSKELSKLHETIRSNDNESSIYYKIIILQPKIELNKAKEIAKNIEKHSRDYNVEANLILSIIYVESRFDPEAVSHAGAIGLMQVMEGWQNAWDINEDLRNINTNIKYGTQVYSTYRHIWSDVELILTAYNRGPGPVESAMRKGEDPRNGYARKVLEIYSRLNSIDSK